jgi:hypothetical protein
MTPDAQRPQREYIITEEQVQTVQHLFSIPDHAMDDADYMMQNEILEAIRTHPHTPAPELSLTGDIKYYFDAGWEKGYEHGKAESARAATLAFIPLAEELASPSVSDARKREIIESLRRTAQEQQR